MAADEYSRAWCRSQQCTDDPDDVMTLAEMVSAISAIGEEPTPHHVIGREIRRMCLDVEAGRLGIAGDQTRVFDALHRKPVLD